MQHRTSSSPATPSTPLYVVPSADVKDAALRTGERNVDATSGASLEERRALAEHLDDPLNRYYRYPAARGLLRIAGGLPLRPEHITYLHTAIGVLGATVMAFGTTRTAMVVAFLLLEVRMILDCYDGVLARAKKLSSPRGRVLDELGDAVGYIAICVGMNVHLHRAHPGTPVGLFVLLGVFVLVAGAMSGHAYDFYKRRLGSALKDGRDAIAEELDQKHELVSNGSAKWITRFGIWFDRWQVRLYEPGYRGDDAVGTVLERSPSTGVRFLVRLIGFISWDNVLGMISLGVLLDRVLEVELVALAYGIVMFTTARVTIWRVLGRRGQS